MDNLPGLNLKPDSQQLFSTNSYSPFLAEEEDSFPFELSLLSEFQLAGLSDSLFGDLDSSTPNFRSMERYEAVTDELVSRQYQNQTGVA